MAAKLFYAFCITGAFSTYFFAHAQVGSYKELKQDYRNLIARQIHIAVVRTRLNSDHKTLRTNSDIYGQHKNISLEDILQALKDERPLSGPHKTIIFRNKKICVVYDPQSSQIIMVYRTVSFSGDRERIARQIELNKQLPDPKTDDAKSKVAHYRHQVKRLLKQYGKKQSTQLHADRDYKFDSLGTHEEDV